MEMGIEMTHHSIPVWKWEKMKHHMIPAWKWEWQ
jgi:hypothetical protein